MRQIIANVINRELTEEIIPGMRYLHENDLEDAGYGLPEGAISLGSVEYILIESIRNGIDKLYETTPELHPGQDVLSKEQVEVIRAKVMEDLHAIIETVRRNPMPQEAVQKDIEKLERVKQTIAEYFEKILTESSPPKATT